MTMIMNSKLSFISLIALTLIVCISVAAAGSNNNNKGHCAKEDSGCQSEEYTALTQYTDAFTQIEQAINAAFDLIIAAINNRRNTLLERVRQQKEEYGNREKTRKIKLKIHLNNKEDILDNQENVESESFVAMLAEVEEKISKVNSSETVHIRFINNSDVFLDNLHLTGIIVNTSNIISEYKNKLHYIKSIGSYGSGDLQFNCPEYLHTDPSTNRLYVADRNNKRIQVLSLDTFQFIAAFGTEHFKDPLGVTTYGEYVYVTDRNLNNVFKFNADNFQLISSVTETQSGHKLHSPLGITADNNGDIYVADELNNRISIYTSELKFIKYIGEGILAHPQDVRIANNMIYVIDSSPDILHVFDKQGNEVRRLIKRQSGRYIKDLSIDVMGNIIIKDASAESVRIFTNEGEQVHSISAIDKIFSSVAVTNDYRIIIGDCTDDKLHLYMV